MGEEEGALSADIADVEKCGDDDGDGIGDGDGAGSGTLGLEREVEDEAEEPGDGRGDEEFDDGGKTGIGEIVETAEVFEVAELLLEVHLGFAALAFGEVDGDFFHPATLAD